MSTPEINIYLCSGVRLNSSYNHSIYFEDRAKQRAYFSGKVVKTLTAYSYVRRSWTLKVEATLIEAVKWNYLFFHYPDDDRYYYYFINKVEYVNDSTVELTLELDLLQTYLFDVSFGDCLIEREHVDDDTIGKHTVSEGLDAGELRYKESHFLTDLTDYVIMIMATFNPMTVTSSASAVTGGDIYGNVYSALGIYAVPYDKRDHLSNKLSRLSEWKLIDGIVSMWVFPKALIKLEGDQQWTDDIWCFNVGNTKDKNYKFAFSRAIGGYTAKNRKLYTYPFNLIEVSNNCGSSVTYRFEYLMDDDGAISFDVYSALSPDSGMRCVPSNYLDGAFANGNDHSINLPAFPTCAWSSDTYKIWLAQNQHSVETQKATSIVGAAAGAASIIGGVAMIATGAGAAVGAGMVGGGVLGIVNSGIQYQDAIATQDSAEKSSPQAHGNFSPTINAAVGFHTFTIAQRQITVERAKIIDDYFTVYGYKVNRIGKPPKHNRKAFTYVKTIGCHAYGNITNEDITKIQSIYDNGITWWVNGDQIGNYSLDNATL